MLIQNILDDYMESRRGYDKPTEPFFVFNDGSHVKPCHVRSVLRNALRLIGLNPELYNTHSFRIGRATDLIKMGFTIDQVKLVSRWRSNAVYKYIRQCN